jgi:HlyD family secretion protein
MTRWQKAAQRPRNVVIAVLVVALAGVASMVRARGGSLPDVPMADVISGEFVDTLEIRGEIRPVKSQVLSSPLQSGELQIVTLVKNGTIVKAGDVLVQFDGSNLQRTVQEKQSELKQAEAEIEQTAAQARLVAEQNETALMRARYDVERAKLDVQKGDIVSRIEQEQAKLTLGDAEQRLREVEARIASDRTAAEADIQARQRKREKAIFDLARAQTGLANLQVKSPAAGMVNILPNFRSGGMFGGQQEFRAGDRAWPGAAILELPDLSSIHLEARLDESDRGRLEVGQDATIRIEAVPGRDFKARIDKISLLARVDHSSGWPPPKNFDLGLVLLDSDERIRPGMTAVARIATDRVPEVILVPSESIFQRDGAPIVYRLAGTEFEERRVEVTRRGREQTIIGSGLAPGDRVATRRPAPDQVRSR